MLLVLLLLLVGTAIFEGSESGFYSLSRLRIAAEAKQEKPIARLIERLFRNPAAHLITLLVGSNLCLEVLAHLTQAEIAKLSFLPPWGVEFVLTLLLTPLVFFFGQLLPKDLFRRRPRRLVGLAAPLLLVARVLFLPVVWPLEKISLFLEQLLGVRPRDFERALGRESAMEVMREGARAGVLAPRAQELALNVFEYRTLTLASVLVPWAEVDFVDADQEPAEVRRRIASSDCSRLPVVVSTPEGPRVVGYVHQLDLLADTLDGGAEQPLEAFVRPLLALPPELTVDRALARLRAGGQRIALVGTPSDPHGIVTLKDLVQTISGELGGW
jgi:CBS domain containing-hemolysin-like protein